MNKRPNTKRKLPNLAIVEELKKASLESFSHGHYLQSAIIIFQTVESLLRIAIRAYGKDYGVSEVNLQEAANIEISFARLVLHFNLIYPENGLDKRLREFNKKRNRIIHRLFIDFESMSRLKEHLKKFCMEGISLNKELRKLLGVADN